MVSAREAVSDAIRDFMCAASQQPADFVDWISNATSSATGLPISTAFGNDAIQNARRVLCPGPGGGNGGGGFSVSYPGPQFPPGQCDLAVYNVDWSFTNGVGQDITGPSNGLLGPIAGIRTIQRGNGNFAVQILCRGVAGNFPEPPGTPFTVADNQPGPIEDLSIDGIAIVGSQPDECGDPLPPEPPTGSGPITYDDDDGTPVVDEPITIAPRFPVVFPNGDVNLGFIVISPSFELNPVFNFNTGDITFNIGGGRSGGECCPIPVGDGDIVPEEGDPPPPENEERFVGVKVRVTFNVSPPNQTQVLGPGQPVWYLPDVGVIRFAVQLGTKRGWSEARRIQTGNQIVQVPDGLLGYNWSVIPREGVSINVEPIIVEV